MASASRQAVGAPASGASQVRVRFTRVHRHAGILYAPGDELTVDAGDAALMRHFMVIEPDSDEVGSIAPAEPSALAVDPDAEAPDSEGG